MSPGYARAGAAIRTHSERQDQGAVPRDLLARRNAPASGVATQSSLFLDFLAGNQQLPVHPVGESDRNVFGWQKPCYLLAEGYASSFQEPMENTDWDNYGVEELREMRRLHGALRLRGDRGFGAIIAPAEGGDGLRPHPDRRADGTRDPAGRPAPGSSFTTSSCATPLPELPDRQGAVRAQPCGVNPTASGALTGRPRAPRTAGAEQLAVAPGGCRRRVEECAVRGERRPGDDRPSFQGLSDLLGRGYSTPSTVDRR